jgi:hypothetical protein
MTANVKLWDQAARVGIGLAFLISPLLELRTYPYNLLGLVLLATGFVGYCPIYGAVRRLLPTKAHEPVMSRG